VKSEEWAIKWSCSCQALGVDATEAARDEAQETEVFRSAFENGKET
jgi:hypothetical protein